MFVVKQKPHQKYKRRGADLIVEQEITLEEALTGGTFTMEHLGGKKVALTIDPGKFIKPNEVMTVDGLGMPNFQSSGANGSLYVIISIKFPSTLEESRLTSLLKVSPLRKSVEFGATETRRKNGRSCGRESSDERFQS